MTLITQQDIREILPDAKWSSEKLFSVIGCGISLKDFIVHPEVSANEALMVALNNSRIGVSSYVVKGILTNVVNRIIHQLKSSPLIEIHSFCRRWEESPLSIPEKTGSSLKSVTWIQSVSNTACLADDWRSFLATQVIKKAYISTGFHLEAHGICLMARYVYVGLPNGWVTERNQQYEDLVRLISEMGE